jgi:hypothetical protein
MIDINHKDIGEIMEHTFSDAEYGDCNIYIASKDREEAIKKEIEELVGD